MSRTENLSSWGFLPSWDSSYEYFHKDPIRSSPCRVGSLTVSGNAPSVQSLYGLCCMPSTWKFWEPQGAPVWRSCPSYIVNLFSICCLGSSANLKELLLGSSISYLMSEFFLVNRAPGGSWCQDPILMASPFWPLTNLGLGRNGHCHFCLSSEQCKSPDSLASLPRCPNYPFKYFYKVTLALI